MHDFVHFVAVNESCKWLRIFVRQSCKSVIGDIVML